MGHPRADPVVKMKGLIVVGDKGTEEKWFREDNIKVVGVGRASDMRVNGKP